MRFDYRPGPNRLESEAFSPEMDGGKAPGENDGFLLALT